ncbi:mandelate racemase/muconate lactonizing enzyme family protein [Ancylobacter terrae]|uniref:mandelate racemase/muconate lactonizing enzyme family protein n=1 Tax=Ancylobacter sp. sgz301288 TaxID=3342077 RepID=UPI00385C474B
MSRLRQIRLTRLCLPLIRPYRLSYRTFDEFEPYLVEVEDSDGRTGFADAHISPGSSSETRDGGWTFCLAKMDAILGKTPEEAKAIILADFAQSKVAATALATAIEVLEGSAFLDVAEPRRQPLLTPINSTELDAIGPEVDGWIAEGFRTFKVKVGKDVEADLRRVARIQEVVDGRATLRLDANRGFSREDGVAFASRLDPTSIDLFEQPCDSDDWEANAAVAHASTVPLMLDEPICTLEDIERAGAIEGVGFCKLKLKRFGSLERLAKGLNAVRARGMSPVLGDGLGSEIQGWLEACVALDTVDNAGEFNGFLKAKTGLFENPLPFEDGEVRMPAGYRPRLDRAAVERATIATHQVAV